MSIDQASPCLLCSLMLWALQNDATQAPFSLSFLGTLSMSLYCIFNTWQWALAQWLPLLSSPYHISKWEETSPHQAMWQHRAALMTMHSQTCGHMLLILACVWFFVTDKRTRLPPPEFRNDWQLHLVFMWVLLNICKYCKPVMKGKVVLMLWLENYARRFWGLWWGWGLHCLSAGMEWKW